MERTNMKVLGIRSLR